MKRIFSNCRQAATEGIPENQFRWFEDEKYLELAPIQSNKGLMVKYLIDHYPFSDSLPVCIGDDSKDEEAFGMIHSFGGITIQVSNPEHPSRMKEADFLLGSPQEVRKRLTRWAGLLTVKS